MREATQRQSLLDEGGPASPSPLLCARMLPRGQRTLNGWRAGTRAQSLETIYQVEVIVGVCQLNEFQLTTRITGKNVCFSLVQNGNIQDDAECGALLASVRADLNPILRPP
jgi:hypothetical protein